MAYSLLTFWFGIGLSCGASSNSSAKSSSRMERPHFCVGAPPKEGRKEVKKQSGRKQGRGFHHLSGLLQHCQHILRIIHHFFCDFIRYHHHHHHHPFSSLITSHCQIKSGEKKHMFQSLSTFCSCVGSCATPTPPPPAPAVAFTKHIHAGISHHVSLFLFGFTSDMFHHVLQSSMIFGYFITFQCFRLCPHCSSSVLTCFFMICRQVSVLHSFFEYLEVTVIIFHYMRRIA